MRLGTVSTNESARMLATDQSEAWKLTPIQFLVVRDTIPGSWESSIGEVFEGAQSTRCYIGQRFTGAFRDGSEQKG